MARIHKNSLHDTHSLSLTYGVIFSWYLGANNMLGESGRKETEYWVHNTDLSQLVLVLLAHVLYFMLKFNCFSQHNLSCEGDYWRKSSWFKIIVVYFRYNGKTLQTQQNTVKVVNLRTCLFLFLKWMLVTTWGKLTTENSMFRFPIFHHLFT